MLCARGGIRTRLSPLQTQGTSQNIPNTAQSGTNTTQSDRKSVYVVHTPNLTVLELKAGSGKPHSYTPPGVPDCSPKLTSKAQAVPKSVATVNADIDESMSSRHGSSLNPRLVQPRVGETLETPLSGLAHQFCGSLTEIFTAAHSLYRLATWWNWDGSCGPALDRPCDPQCRTRCAHHL